MANQSLIVSKSIFNRKKSINEAIKSAKSGDTIYIESGVYHENIVIRKSIHLVAKEGAGRVKIVGHGAPAIKVHANNVSITGLILTQKGPKIDHLQAAVHLQFGKTTISHCTIAGATSNGIRITEKASQSVIQKCRIEKNKCTGIVVTGNTLATIDACEINHNEGEGLRIEKGAKPTVQHCKIFKNKGTAFSNGEQLGANILILGGQTAPFIRDTLVYEGAQLGIRFDNGAKGTLQQVAIYGHKASNVIIRNLSDPMIKACEIYNGEREGIQISHNGRGYIENSNIYHNYLGNVHVLQASPKFDKTHIYQGQREGIHVGYQGNATFNQCEIYENKQANVLILNAQTRLMNCKIFEGEQNGICIQNHAQVVLECCDIYSNQFANVIVENSELNAELTTIRNGQSCGIWFKKKSAGKLVNMKINGHLQNAQMVIESGSHPTFQHLKVSNGGDVGIYVEQAELTLIDAFIAPHTLKDVLQENGTIMYKLYVEEVKPTPKTEEFKPKPKPKRKQQEKKPKPTPVQKPPISPLAKKCLEHFQINPEQAPRKQLEDVLNKERRKYNKLLNAPSKKKQQEAEAMVDLLAEISRAYLK